MTIQGTLINVAFLLVILGGNANAFTTSPSRSTTVSRVYQNDFALGPKARNGLGFEDTDLGDGRRILPGDTVLVYYNGSFKTGPLAKPTVFDKTTEGQPFSFVVGKGQVIKGWDLGVLGGLEGEIPPMNVGGVRRLEIPSGLAYGEEGSGPIPPNQDLLFDVQVLRAGKESDISLQFRLGGYVVALGVPAVALFIAYNLLSGNW